MSEEKKYYCQYCGAELKQDPQNDDSMLCYGCKRRFNKAEVVQWAMFVMNSPTLTTKDDEKTPADGSKDAGTAGADGKKPNKKLIAIICIAVAVVLVAVGVCIALLGQDDSNTAEEPGDTPQITNANVSDEGNPDVYDVPSYAQYTMSPEELEEAYKDYSLPPYVVATESAPWGELKFTYNGEEYQIGNMTLKEFEEKSGLILNLARYGKIDDYTMSAGDWMEFAELSSDNNKVIAQVTVANLTDSPLNIHDCIVTGFDIRTFTMVPDTGIVGTDIKIGSSADSAVKGLGDPFSRTPGENTEVIEFKDDTNMLNMAVYNRAGAVEGFKLFMYDDNF